MSDSSDKKKLYFVIEKDWVIEDDAIAITSRLNKNYNFPCEVTLDFENIKSSVIHFGARHLYLLTENYNKVDPSNKVMFTWYHSSDADTEFIESLKIGAQKANYIHTSNDIAANKLIAWGVPKEKIVKIPIALDIKHFKPVSKEEKLVLRNLENIPIDATVIGSFQKDGNGWGEGLEPKMVKGPDIFCDVVEKLKNEIPNLFILLTGPARGYVKSRLEKAGIPYKHVFLKDPSEVNKYYNMIDLYIVTSRVEGGPKAVMESMSSGIPIISTKVGMAPELIKNGENGFLTEVEDVSALTSKSLEILNNEALRNKFIENALRDIKHLDWDVVVEEYYKLYSKMYAEIQ